MNDRAENGSSGLNGTPWNRSSKIPPVPSWAEGWFDMKMGAGLKVATLQRYSADLRAFNLDVSTSNLQEIRHRLAELSTHYKRGSQRAIAKTIRSVLKELDRKEDAEKIPVPKEAEPRVVVYSKEDIEQILKNCKTIRDRLLIEMLIETGARRGEIFNMQLKDIQYDQYSPIVYLHGKTGTRTRRLFNCAPDLVAYLSTHPDRQNPEAKFWVTISGKPLQYQGIYKLVRIVGYRGLRRTVFPHGFRHTSITNDAKNGWSDEYLKLRHGWEKGSDMAKVYVHLTAQDMDEKDLYLHGLNNRSCPKCHGNVNPSAKFCENCGQGLQQEVKAE
jgi:integrase